MEAAAEVALPAVERVPTEAAPWLPSSHRVRSPDWEARRGVMVVGEEGIDERWFLGWGRAKEELLPPNEKASAKEPLSDLPREGLEAAYPSCRLL